MNIADLRKDYALKGLDEKEVLPDPFAQFSLWMNEALSAKLPEPTAMTLATAAPLAGGGAQPTARIVLLKGVDARGFVFFTNYSSRKGRELAANPFAGLLFHWVELEREVHVDGRIEKVDAKESDAYFATRPLLSRIGRKVVTLSTRSRGPVGPTRVRASSRMVSIRPCRLSELAVWKSHASVSDARGTPAPSSRVNTSLKRACRVPSAGSPAVVPSRSRAKASDEAMAAPTEVRRPRNATT